MKKLQKIWGLLASTTLVPFLSVFWSLVVILIYFFHGSHRLGTWAIRMWARSLLGVLGLKIRVHGSSSRYDPYRPLLIVSNHQSYLDIPIAYAVLSGSIRMLSKKEIFYLPIFGQAMWISGTIALDRSSRSSREASLRKMRKRLEEGIQVWIAPEGTRSPNGQLGLFKRGAFVLACELRLPIQPVVIHNAYEVLSKKDWIPKAFSVIDVSLLELEEEHLFKENFSKEALSEKVRSRMLLELEEFRKTQAILR